VDDIGLHSQKSQPMFLGDEKHKYENNRSRVLGNVLGYLQAYLNRIISKVNPDYEIEFVGYEKDDPKEILDIDKGEVESYKTLNDKREEKGLPKLENAMWDIPMNPQAVQLFQSSQGGMSGMEDTGDNGDDGDSGEEDWGEPSLETEGEERGEETKEDASGGENDSREKSPAPDYEGMDFGKSIRIVV